MFSIINSTATRRLRFAVLLASLCTFGCEPNKPKEVSSENSGYLPKDIAEKSANSKTATSAESSSTPASQSTASSDKTAASAASSQPSGSSAAPGALPTAPELPNFQPGKADPTTAKKEYMQLSLPKDMANEAALLKYLADNTKATSELINETNRKAITREAGLDRAFQLGNDKVQAAEALMKISKEDETIQGAIIAKFEALTQMASLGDISASDRLSEFAEGQSNSKYPAVAEQATALLISLAINELNKDLIDVDKFNTVLDRAYALEKPGIPTLQIVNAALQSLGNHTGEPQLERAKQLAEKYKSEDVDQLMVASYQMVLSHAPSWIELKNALLPESNLLRKPDEVNEIVQRVVKDLNGDLLPLFLLSEATNVEYSAQPKTAKVLVDAASKMVDGISNAKIKEEVSSNCEGFLKRLSLMGGNIDFSDLAELDGKAFDFAQYAGKIVVVDFWATWCVPCINEIPNLEKLVKERQGDGVEVLGINLDDKRSDLESFLKANPLPWKNIVSADANAAGFQSAIVKRLGISAIPFVAVIGRDGKVVAMHTRGRLLEQKIDELLAAEKVNKDGATDANASNESPDASSDSAAEPTATENTSTEKPAETPTEQTAEPAAQPTEDASQPSETK